jgi:excisionase family DNA binding protein
MASTVGVMPDPLLVDALTAADMLSVSVSTVQRLVSEGALVRIKIGSRSLLPVAALQAFVDSQVSLQLAPPQDGSEASNVEPGVGEGEGPFRRAVAEAEEAELRVSRGPYL